MLENPSKHSASVIEPIMRNVFSGSHVSKNEIILSKIKKLLISHLVVKLIVKSKAYEPKF